MRDDLTRPPSVVSQACGASVTRRDLVPVLVEALLLDIPALRVELLAVIMTLSARIELLSLCASVVLVRTRFGVAILRTAAITAQLVATVAFMTPVVAAEPVVVAVVAAEAFTTPVVAAEPVVVAVVAAIMTMVVTVGSASGPGSTGACGTSRTGG